MSVLDKPSASNTVSLKIYFPATKFTSCNTASWSVPFRMSCKKGNYCLRDLVHFEPVEGNHFLIYSNGNFHYGLLKFLYPAFTHVQCAFTLSTTTALPIDAAFFLYPLVLVPVPTQLGKIASKSNKLGIFWQCIGKLFLTLKKGLKTKGDLFISLQIYFSCFQVFESVYNSRHLQ